MTVSSPPSRPEPDGGETGSGSVRSPPSPSNNDNMSTSTTSSNQTQSTVEGTGIQKNTVKQVTPPKTTQVVIQQENHSVAIQIKHSGRMIVLERILERKFLEV